MSGAIATLCATSTLGAAAAGLTFGSPSEPPLLQSSAGWPPTPTTPRSLPLDLRTQPSPMSCFGQPAANHHHFSFSRPITSHARPRPSIHDSGRASIAHEQKDIEDDQPRRLSTANHTRRAHPAVEESKRSGLHTESTNTETPDVSPRPLKSRRSIDEGPLPPNKLVKRSLSRRAPSNDPLVLKRPATSHQRAASLQAFSAFPPRPTTSAKPYRHFFNIWHIRDSSSPTSAGDWGIRQVRPSGSAPTLLSGNVVEPAQVSTGLPAVQSCFEFTSPRTASSNSPRSFPSLSSASNTPQNAGMPQSAGTASPANQSNEKPKRTISFLRKLRNTSEPQLKLRRRFSKRVSSAPITSQEVVMEDAPSTERQAQNDILPSSSPVVEHAQVDETSSPATPTSITYRPASRPYHSSGTTSDRTSSRPGSEGAARVFSWGEDGDSVQTSSDTVYDSMRTGTTRSTAGYPKRGLETLFDQSASSLHNENEDEPFYEAMQDSKLEGHQQDVALMGTTQHPRSPPVFEVHQPDVGQRPEALVAPEEEDEDWDAFDSNVLPGLPASRALPELDSLKGPNPSEAEVSIGALQRDTAVKSSVFDWSEQQPHERGSDIETPPRPKTVHGKKQPDARGSRSAARRAPSGLHTRSQSVPVLQDLVGKSEAAQKFGSWGVNGIGAGKEATEDWDDDFDDNAFGGISVKTDTMPEAQTSRKTLVVPEQIQMQQNSVMENIGYLREWGLAIEELKELKLRIAAEGVPRTLNADLLDQVDAMIDLADQEADEEGPMGFRSPASSVNFSDDGFDTPPPPESSKTRSRLSPSEMLRVLQRPKAVKTSPRVDSPEPFTRPRKDSEVVAMTVIGALQHWRKPADPEETPGKKQKKVPFDTATLKHIVPYVSNLVRQLKEILREAEGLNMSPKQQRHQVEPAFVRNVHPRDESPSASKERRLQLTRALNGSGSGSPTVSTKEESGLITQMKLMGVT